MRIRSGAEYDRVFGKGRSFNTSHFRVIVATAETGLSRVGLVVSKKVGRRAHDRNRVKRYVREFFRLNRAGLETAIDVVVVAKPGAAGLGWDGVAEQLARALKPCSPAPRSH